ncbi:MAG: diadenosine tetraphosphate (Ap4A) HIT family hydrolase [Mariniblastus sp.]|jgi:diadenosine tetraphosphate (Ap4A) HIT family hydrolase
MSFELHPNLRRDGISLGRFPLCELLLINDASYPWFVLVPHRSGVRDTTDLSEEDHQSLWQESRALGSAIMDLFVGEKLNVAALGNVTPQLHIHHVVRYQRDAAWPGPIWGVKGLVPYEKADVKAIQAKFANAKILGFVAL